jgi:predicted AAA+ superfamily ATPase
MVQRELYLDKIRPFIDADVVKVLTGIRRCGKTVMLGLVREELLRRGIPASRMLFINVESGSDPAVRSREAVYARIKAMAGKLEGKLYLFLDEVQEMEGWERLVNSCMIDFDIDIYITGSNAKMLSGELATYLGGRYVEIKLYPFSFKEVMESYAQTRDTPDQAEIFARYLTLGGMPFLHSHTLDETSAKQYLSDIFNSIILKDIAQRNKVRDIERLERLILFFIANVGNTLSAASIVRYLKNEKRGLSTETIYNYISYCKEACLLHLVPREDLIGKKALSFQEKVYLSDHGLREAVYGNNQRDIGQILENIVYMELLRHGYDVHVGKIGSAEVDFAARKGGEKLYIQVAYLLADDRIIEREFSPLEAIPDNYPKYVLSMDELDRSRNGIRHMNIRRFLLEQSWA